MRSAIKLLTISILSGSLSLFFFLIGDRQNSAHIIATAYRPSPKLSEDVIIREEQASPTNYEREALALKRALHVVNAPTLLQKMDHPRKSFQFILEPKNLLLSPKDSEPGEIIILILPIQANEKETL